MEALLPINSISVPCDEVGTSSSVSTQEVTLQNTIIELNNITMTSVSEVEKTPRFDTFRGFF